LSASYYFAYGRS